MPLGLIMMRRHLIVIKLCRIGGCSDIDRILIEVYIIVCPQRMPRDRGHFLLFSRSFTDSAGAAHLLLQLTLDSSRSSGSIGITVIIDKSRVLSRALFSLASVIGHRLLSLSVVIFKESQDEDLWTRRISLGANAPEPRPM